MQGGARAIPLGGGFNPLSQAPARTKPPDTWLVAVVGTLVGLGLVMVFSASSATAAALHHDIAYFLKRQALWLALALVCALGTYKLDYRVLRKLAPAILVVALLALVAVLIPHVGLLSGGARRWLGAGPISFQPSEFAKLAMVIYLAAAITRHHDRIRSLTRGLWPLFMVTFAVAGLILIEPDMGTASLVVFTTFAMLFVAGARIPHLLAVVLVTAPPIAYSILASPYKRARIFAFVDPWRDAQNTGFHIVQSLLALGSGGIFGLGLGLSRQKFFYLPEQYTDFIFAIVGEELGLIGALFVIALFLFFAYRATKIALAAPDEFGFFLVVGCTALIVLQAFVNIG
ncbi:MAG: putative lipid II flippase FtsW, partial [Candidatus Eremiobacteraeota bacterium]|nr:putative lipid II flippase FtsW [Candidatus Eremiobacteraeota bacterium]